jgi:hypothetical protein
VEKIAGRKRRRKLHIRCFKKKNQSKQNSKLISADCMLAVTRAREREALAAGAV